MNFSSATAITPTATPNTTDRQRFLGLDEPDYDAASTVIWPLPFERTTSYGQGTANGPEALLQASQFVETYDSELDYVPFDSGFHTLPPLHPAAEDLAPALDEIRVAAEQHMRTGKFLVAIGGEHSLSLPLVQAAKTVYGDSLGVVQFDAHADLRQEYEGTPYSHACVMRRIVDLGVPTLGVGIRSLSADEAQFIKDSHRTSVLWARQLHHESATGSTAAFERQLEELPDQIYLTIDVDFFDPSLIPATGTPEPGGGHWYDTTILLRRLFESKKVVAMDLVELAPRSGQPESDFIAAKLLYKAIGYHCSHR